MALNYPGPYELRQFYSVDGEDHEFRVSIQLNAPIAIGAEFTDIEGTSEDGSLVTLSSFVDNMLDSMKAHIPSDTGAFGITELWIYQANSFEATYVSAYNSSIAPTGGSLERVALQVTYTWRTVEGGIMKLVLLDVSGDDEGGRNSYPTGGNTADAVFEFFTDKSNSLAVARDTSRPFKGLRQSFGQNELLFRKRTGRS